MRKEHHADHQQVPNPSPMGPPQVGTANREARRRRQLHPPRSQRGAPELLLKLRHQGKKKRRTRTSPLRNLEREEASCTLTPYNLKACTCGHAKMIHHKKSGVLLECNFPSCQCRLYFPARTEPLL